MNGNSDFVVVSGVDGDVKEMNSVFGVFESSFDSVVDVIHEVYESGEFCEYEEDVVDEAFPYENVDIFDSTHEMFAYGGAYLPHIDVPVFCM